MRRKVRGFNKILQSHQEKGNGQGNGPAYICGGLFKCRCTKSLLSLFSPFGVLALCTNSLYKKSHDVCEYRDKSRNRNVGKIMRSDGQAREGGNRPPKNVLHNRGKKQKNEKIKIFF